LLQFNYISPVVTPTDTPREKINFTSCVVIEQEVKELLTSKEEEVPKGTTSLDDMFDEAYDDVLNNEFGDKLMKNDGVKQLIKERYPKEQVKKFINLEDQYEIAPDEEVIRVLTKQKNAFEKGLGDKLYSDPTQSEGILLNIDIALSDKKRREAYSVDRIKTIEKELDEQMKEYGFTDPLRDRYFIDKLYETAPDEEVIRVLTKQKNALEKGLGAHLYKDATKGIILKIDIDLSDKKRREGYDIYKIKKIEKELDEQMKEYGFEEIKEEVNLKDVLSKLSVAFENKDVETIKSLQKYVPTDYTHWRVADAFSVTNFLEKKRKALKNGLASHLYDNEYQEDAAYFDIQNKLNDHIGLNMYMEKTFKQMEKELDEQIKKYGIVID